MADGKIFHPADLQCARARYRCCWQVARPVVRRLWQDSTKLSSPGTPPGDVCSFAGENWVTPEVVFYRKVSLLRWNSSGCWRTLPSRFSHTSRQAPPSLPRGEKQKQLLQERQSNPCFKSGMSRLVHANRLSTSGKNSQLVVRCKSLNFGSYLPQREGPLFARASSSTASGRCCVCVLALWNEGHPVQKVAVLPPEVHLSSLGTPSKLWYALCVWVVKLEANGASTLAFSYKLDGSVIWTSLQSFNYGGLRTLGMLLAAAWKISTGETMQRATDFAVLRCVRCVQVTSESLRDDFWSTFTNTILLKMFLFKSSLRKDRAILSETSGQRKLVCWCWGRAKRLTWPSKNLKKNVHVVIFSICNAYTLRWGDREVVMQKSVSFSSKMKLNGTWLFANVEAMRVKRQRIN